jgi:hypothetical protein
LANKFESGSQPSKINVSPTTYGWVPRPLWITQDPRYPIDCSNCNEPFRWLTH